MGCRTFRWFAGFREAETSYPDVPSVLSTFERGVLKRDQSTKMMKQAGRWEQQWSERSTEDVA
jgi:hypothetical protein